MFAKLGAGFAQSRHKDMGLSSLPPHKIHIPLSDGGGGASFYMRPDDSAYGGKGREGKGREDAADGQGGKGRRGKASGEGSDLPESDEVGVKLDVGYAYEVNNLLTHHASNEGDKDRVHVLFEFLPRDVGSHWSDATGPETQSEKQARERAHRESLSPAELEAFWEEKLLNDTTRSKMIQASLRKARELRDAAASGKEPVEL
eukprot:TRINITY_DN21490_c0_g1_i1.p1 TRINITY_DN21490_c0_g1~~TRINITY_DN21490_c0_g1_i1.p1  ORF type:complete len:202 (-),score=45.83 TRINITY_DN21490_c0_g1_i1:237-842(-)